MKLLKSIFAILMVFLAFQGGSYADSKLCKGRFLNPILDINWDLVFPITVAGMQMSLNHGSPESPLTYLSPVCLCPGHIFGVPTPGVEVTFHEPLYIEEIAKNPGCFSSIGGVKILGGYDMEQTDLKEDANSTSRWQIHWYEYPVFTILKLFQDFVCVQGGGYALAYITELDPTWQNDAWGAVFSPESAIFANKLAAASCAIDAVASAVKHPLDAMFWCAGSWGSVYPLTGNANSSVGRIQSAELVGAKLIARLSRIGMLWDSVGSWAECSPVPMPIWIKSEFTVDPVYPIISSGDGMAIGAPPATNMYKPVESYPLYENINQVIFQEQQCCIHP